MTFQKLGLSKAMLTAIDKQNFSKPTPIQTKAIPAILKRKDVLGIAKTGSGKTISYLVPLLEQLQQTPPNKGRNIKALILVPTRELAIQIRECCDALAVELPQKIKSLAVYGGVSINPQMQAMRGVDLLVATPGRLLDLIGSNALKLFDVGHLVLDEADRMLSMGFKEEMNDIFRLLPEQRQNLLFSATLGDNVQSISQMILHNPQVVQIAEEVSVDLIQQVGYFVEHEKKGPLLRHLITSEDMQQVLIFASSAHRADAITDKLRKHNIDARAIHSKKGQNARIDFLTKFKNGKLRVLVTTDLLARGIDIEFLPYVINYELPRSPKDFVHRIGRTGRAENPGTAITFVAEDEKHHFKVIQKKMKKWVDMIEWHHQEE